MKDTFGKIRLVLLLVAFTLGAVSFLPVVSTAQVPNADIVQGPCHDMGCPGGPWLCDYLPSGAPCALGAAAIENSPTNPTQPN